MARLAGGVSGEETPTQFKAGRLEHVHETQHLVDEKAVGLLGRRVLFLVHRKPDLIHGRMYERKDEKWNQDSRRTIGNFRIPRNETRPGWNQGFGGAHGGISGFREMPQREYGTDLPRKRGWFRGSPECGKKGFRKKGGAGPGPPPRVIPPARISQRKFFCSEKCSRVGGVAPSPLVWGEGVHPYTTPRRWGTRSSPP
jgi:hypothetical protein